MAMIVDSTSDVIDEHVAAILEQAKAEVCS